MDCHLSHIPLRDTTSFNGSPVTIGPTPQKNCIYRWESQDTGFDHTVAQPIIRDCIRCVFFLFVTDTTLTPPCDKWTDSVHVRQGSAVFPLVYTPNGDGINDFVTFGDGSQVFHLSIYDRYGKIMLDDPDYRNNWPPRDHDPKTIPKGVYYYVIRVVKEGNTKEYAGDITLIR